MYRDFNPFCTLYMPKRLYSLYLFVKSKYKIPRYVQQISQKIQRYKILLILPSPTLKKHTFGIFSSMCPLVTSGEKPKAFFSLPEFMPFKFKYNSDVDNILVKKIEFSFSANLTALIRIMDVQPTNLLQLCDAIMSNGPKSLRNVSNTLLNLCHEELRQF